MTRALRDVGTVTDEILVHVVIEYKATDRSVPLLSGGSACEPPDLRAQQADSPKRSSGRPGGPTTVRTWLVIALVLLSGCASPPATEDAPADEPRAPGEPPAPRAGPVSPNEPTKPQLPVPSFEAAAGGPTATGPPPGPDPSAGTPDPAAEPSPDAEPGPGAEPVREAEPAPKAEPTPKAEPARPIGTTSAPRPVRFLAGSDAPDGKFLVSLSLGANGASFDASLRAVPDATLRIDSLVRLTNTGTKPHDVTLSAEPLVDARVVRASLLVAGARVDLAGASPSLTLALAPGDAWDVGLELELRSATPGGTLTHTVTLAVW